MKTEGVYVIVFGVEIALLVLGCILLGFEVLIWFGCFLVAISLTALVITFLEFITS